MSRGRETFLTLYLARALSLETVARIFNLLDIHVIIVIGYTCYQTCIVIITLTGKKMSAVSVRQL